MFYRLLILIASLGLTSIVNAEPSTFSCPSVDELYQNENNKAVLNIQDLNWRIDKNPKPYGQDLALRQVFIDNGFIDCQYQWSDDDDAEISFWTSAKANIKSYDFSATPSWVKKQGNFKCTVSNNEDCEFLLKRK